MKMKKRTLILALLTAVSTSVSAVTVYEDDINTLDIYGRAEGQVANGKGSFSGDEDSNTRARMTGRLGFAASRQLSRFEETRVIGKLEWQMTTEANDTNLDADEELEARYTYVGFDNDSYGTLMVGRTKNPMYQVMKMTDKYKNFTPNVYSYGITSIDDSYKFNRQDGTVQWNGDFSGHQIQAAYIFGNGEDDPMDYAFMMSYRKTVKIEDFKITPALAYSQYNREEGNTDTSRKQHNQTMGGLELGYKGFSFGVTGEYINIDQDNGFDDYIALDTIVSYKWKAFKVLGGYSFLNEKDEDIYEKEDWRIEGQWTLARKTYLSLTYDRELASGNEKSNDDAITLGLRYNF